MNDLNLMLRDKATFLIEMFLTYVVDPRDDEHFALVMKWFCEEGIIDIKDMAREFEVAKTTIQRWITGTARPNPILRSAIFQYLKERTRQFFQQQ